MLPVTYGGSIFSCLLPKVTLFITVSLKAMPWCQTAPLLRFNVAARWISVLSWQRYKAIFGSCYDRKNWIQRRNIKGFWKEYFISQLMFLGTRNLLWQLLCLELNFLTGHLQWKEFSDRPAIQENLRGFDVSLQKYCIDSKSVASIWYLYEVSLWQICDINTTNILM